MRLILFLAISFCFVLSGNSQQDLNRTWFLTELTFLGDNVPIPENTSPDLSINLNPIITSEPYIEGSAACNGYFALIETTDTTFTLSEFSTTQDMCITETEENFENGYFSFFQYSENPTISYEITSTADFPNSNLILTNETGDVATYSAFNPNIPEEIWIEPWYLDYFEIDGQAQNYPPEDPLQYDLHSISFFLENGNLEQSFTCLDGGSSSYTSYDLESVSYIEITVMSLLASDCGSAPSMFYDNDFVDQLQGKTHYYEITEEGAGRRLTLTDENGDRIFYTNAFLNIDDTTTDNAISIYPNPVFEKLFIEASSFFAIKTIAIFNIQGQQIWQSDFRSEIDVSALSSGLYFVKFSDGNSESIHRFLKK